MALYGYMQEVERLLHDLKQEIVNPANIILFINNARGQVAGESECIRTIGTISSVVGQRVYNFSSLNIGTPSTTGVQGIINVRRINYSVADGQKWIAPKAWEWFDFYFLNNPTPQNGVPITWAQYGQGAGVTGAATGSFYLDPPPDAIYTLSCDCVCYPQDLVDDTTVEAIPFLWTNAVAYYAAYLAYLNIQKADMAKSMFEQYKVFIQRARQAANPSLNRFMYSQSVDPSRLSKFGLAKAGD